ncbi:MAG: hypothetical protein A3H28_12880 [Acidobacteria bacterium RIFCSPLOWO2_02_FULL_61_28]|nr:MAG: hypothetical protein A3H28_12880 [Acidobacteria bacterium RIFCSPLOWO2_02_FULL_61_28]
MSGILGATEQDSVRENIRDGKPAAEARSVGLRMVPGGNGRRCRLRPNERQGFAAAQENGPQEPNPISFHRSL